jgi:hypothetical protein
MTLVHGCDCPDNLPEKVMVWVIGYCASLSSVNRIPKVWLIAKAFWQPSESNQSNIGWQDFRGRIDTLAEPSSPPLLSIPA